MSKEGVDLAVHARRVHSGAGEDGILEKIYSLLGTETGFFVEFGAWDGQRLSNTRLLREKGWRGLLIEGDGEKFAALKRNVTTPGVRLVQAMVEPSGDSSLDAILAREDCPRQLDILSIDIDGDDLAVWLGLKKFRARCVVIEFNPSIPFDTHFVNPRGRNWGNSALTISHFAQSLGYALVAVTGMNLIFLDSASAAAAGIAAISLDAKYAAQAPRFFWGYDGTLLSAGACSKAGMPEVLQVPFHDYAFAQPMPKFLRRWHLGKEWRMAERLWSNLALLLSRPVSYFRRPKKSPGRRKV